MITGAWSASPIQLYSTIVPNQPPTPMTRHSYQEDMMSALALNCELVSTKADSMEIRGGETKKPLSALEHIDKIESSPSYSNQDPDFRFAETQSRFEKQYPQFSKTKNVFEDLRRTEFSALDRDGCTYLDFTGAALAPQSLVDEHFKFLRSNLLGNPHSAHEPSLRATYQDEAARQAVLDFCHADPSVYTVIWTDNSSAALKIVGENYPFSKKGAFVFAPDCHNSVLGISEYAKRKGAAVQGFKFGENWTSSYDYDDLEDVMDSLTKKKASCMPSLYSRTKTNRLLAVPAQSNVSGVKHCTKRIVDAAHQRGWDVMLDTAALAPTSEVNLSDLSEPEFVCLSFYKIFGYPTGIGALVAKKSALCRLQKQWFAGGTVRAVSAQPDHVFSLSYDEGMHQRWEDGTINFQQTAAVKMGLDWIQSVGMSNIRLHTSSLIGWISGEMKQLKWDNGAPFCFIPEVEGGEQGSTVSMVVLSRDGKIVPHKVMEARTAAAKFAVRTGCFCNPGGAYRILGWADPTIVNDNMLKENFNKRYQVFEKVYATKGLVRVSVGIPTTFADVYRLLRFFETEILAKPNEFEAEVAHFIATLETPYSFC